ncbi:translation initiation factor IF-2 [Hyperthermus butylicus]|uniref:Probable translation initiation factor IF-2 n=1 Tax=Hyperthermus butylicus (strain DSM 5456 / JCM 9403 / PLM1-5) TaxID=415426 RepID=IF2P_HYPBU|nr:translation initiation factor IF-2 [Hyperthermus butylicus]A2BJZ8.1 RecName: Full=Probable translation initiation factor IF-2 [Hyperthermus butylicus DSM 5456]ABM80309.1 translation initiation factor 2 [Hyperthermus butylicus DSM 5456]
MAEQKTSGRRLRQPIVVVLGHVDHGKTTLLDKIRGTTVAAKEPGLITQHVGASFVPASVIEKLAEPLKKIIPFKLIIPGLLFIDTPGHELFANLRRRGGSVADFAILVVDINEGFQPQTYESIEILRQRRVPFVVAANKIDKIPGWRANPDTPFLISLQKQAQRVREELERRLWDNIISKLYELGFQADRFDRIRDFTRTVAVIPISAKTGEGIAELLAVLAGLTQRYLQHRLRFAEGPAKGVILEIREQPGLGTAADVVIYDGVLRKGDIIVTGGLNGPVITHVRALLMPKPLQEIRVAKRELEPVEEVYAAAGVRIVAPGLEEAIAGAPVFVARDEGEAKQLAEKVRREIEALRIKTEAEGVIVKADTLGSLEAMIEALRKRDIPIRYADVGPVAKRDVIEAVASRELNKFYGVILAFNVKVLPEAEEEAKKHGITIFTNNVIYRLLEDFEKWYKEQVEAERRKELEKLVRPGKIRLLPGYVFRRSNPAIVGVEVLGGVIKPGYPLMREDGKRIGTIHQIQDKGKVIHEARAGMAVAISIRGHVMVGRHIDEGDVLYTDIPEQHAVLWLTKFKSELTDDEMVVLKEIIKIKRKQNPAYAVVLGKPQGAKP